ncbi:response regulator [Oceanobacter mangrovi]|uniref:response regulator n=1 Tax=Oceanobacter mangrovi TaxID=2862510 RepID=UPI001C8E492C|nr:response regulator transcription factor [Oceanobacter mangrovi]
MYQVIIADDHPLFRRAMREALAETGEPCVISEACDLPAAWSELTDLGADLLLLDLRMPGMDGLMGLMRLRAEFPGLAIVVVSASEDACVIAQVKQLGAMGYIHKSAPMEQITAALNDVFMGKLSFPDTSPLADQSTAARQLQSMTPQQLRVLQLIAEGALNKQIGYILNIKETTVKSHISDIFRKLEINNRTQAALLVQQLQVPD